MNEGFVHKPPFNKPLNRLEKAFRRSLQVFKKEVYKGLECLLMSWKDLKMPLRNCEKVF